MFALAATGIVFACMVGAALLGMFLQTRLPPHHLTDQSKDTAKMVLAVLGTLTALVLGLLIASAKSSLASKVELLEHALAWTVQLDRALAGYGSETSELRNVLQQSFVSQIHDLFQDRGMSEKGVQGTLSGNRGIETIQRQILNLAAQNDSQRWFQAAALNITNKIEETRWMAVFSTGRSIPPPFLAVLTFWLAAIFTSLGIFAPRNGNVIATLVVCALSVAGAIFLIVQMDQPFAGFVRIPFEPAAMALDQLNKP
jgi:hypothetical protein